MADEPKAGGTSGQTSRSFAWLWMVLAIITVGAFLAWLGLESEPTSVSVVEADTTAEMVEPGVTLVSKDTLAADKSRFDGREIQVANVAATGVLGPRIFWGELGDPSNQVPILIRMDSATAASFTPQVGGYYTIVGIPFPMSDSLATAWLDAGELAGEGERLQAAFADYYIQARRVRPTPASQRESESGSGASSDSAAAGGAGTSG